MFKGAVALKVQVLLLATPSKLGYTPFANSKVILVPGSNIKVKSTPMRTESLKHT